MNVRSVRGWLLSAYAIAATIVVVLLTAHVLLMALATPTSGSAAWCSSVVPDSGREVTVAWHDRTFGPAGGDWRTTACVGARRAGGSRLLFDPVRRTAAVALPPRFTQSLDRSHVPVVTTSYLGPVTSADTTSKVVSALDLLTPYAHRDRQDSPFVDVGALATDSVVTRAELADDGGELRWSVPLQAGRFELGEHDWSARIVWMSPQEATARVGRSA